MVSRVDIIQFIDEFWDMSASLGDEDCIFEKLYIDGDDAFEFMTRYAEKFNVNLDEYRWYFHHGEEGLRVGVGESIFSTPDRKADHIPLSVEALVQSAREGYWVLTYPDHKLSTKRYDRLTNQTVLLALLGAFAWVIIDGLS